MKRLNEIIFKLMLRVFPSYIYSPKLNKLKNLFAKRVLKKVEGSVNFGKNIKMSMDISFGVGSGVGDYALLNGPIMFGDNIMMGPNVTIYRSNHNTSRTDIPMIKQGMTEAQLLRVGNDVWIGDGAIILPGCFVIGEGSVIGARAVVSKDIPPYAVVVGNPAKIVKYRKNLEQ